MTTPVSGVAWAGPGTDDMTLAIIAANAAAANSVGTPATSQYLETYANEDSLEFSNVTYDGNNIISSANVIWPDGTNGVWTTTSASVQGYLIYTVTYLGSPTKTVTVTITRNGNGQATNVSRSVT